MSLSAHRVRPSIAVSDISQAAEFCATVAIKDLDGNGFAIEEETL